MRYSTLSNVITSILDFTNAHNIDAKVNIFDRDELEKSSDEQKANWAAFEKHSGTYCFINKDNEEIQYIGMSLGNTGGRIFHWIFEDETIANLKENSMIVIVTYNSSQYYMAPALESYLIKELKPVLNKKK